MLRNKVDMPFPGMSNPTNSPAVTNEPQMCRHRRRLAPTIEEPLPVMWTASEVARCARCSVRHVGQLRLMGLPCLKIGHMVRFDPQQVLGWLQAHLEHGGGAAENGRTV